MIITIAQQIIAQQAALGHRLLGRTSGQYTFRSGSNLATALTTLGLRAEDVIVLCGAKKQHRTQGTELLIFSK